jgi:hypothetical protein
MGQRHQVFIDFKHEDKKQTLALHDQWSYAQFPIRNLAKLLKYEINTENYKNEERGKYYSFHSGKIRYDLKKTKDILLSIYNVNLEFGTYNNAHEIDEKPDETDNNDGQTFIDFYSNKKKPLYAFAFPHKMDVNLVINDEIRIQEVPPFFVISAREYFYEYYKETIENHIEDMTKLEADEWIEEVEKSIKFIEENSDLMSQEHFNNIYKSRIESLKTDKVELIELQKKKKHLLKIKKIEFIHKNIPEFEEIDNNIVFN